MTCCDVCGAFLENCRCPPCWVCGDVKPSCNDTHRFRAYRTAVEAVLEQAGGNRLVAAEMLGIHNTHLYKKPSPTLKKALREKGYMRIKRKRFRLAADFENEARRQEFIERNLNDVSFTEWVEEQGEK